MKNISNIELDNFITNFFYFSIYKVFVGILFNIKHISYKLLSKIKQLTAVNAILLFSISTSFITDFNFKIIRILLVTN